MYRVFRTLFSSRNREHDFETVVGRLSEVVDRTDIVRAGPMAVPQKKFKGTPMNSLPLLKQMGLFPLGIGNIRQLYRSYNNLQERPSRVSIEEYELDALSRIASSMGVASTGYTEVDPDDIFIDRGILFKNAIIYSIPMPREKMMLAPSYQTLRMIMGTYERTGELTNRVADFLRRRGFGVQAGPGLGGFTIYPVLAWKAGMGAFGSSGLLITPENGPCHRLAVVYTNIENLPAKPKVKHDWITRFCQTCGRCIRECPAGAIRTQPTSKSQQHQEYIEYDRCVEYFAANCGCSICVRVCPFFTSGYKSLLERTDSSDAHQ
jgi:epoxyqueuosine reductase